MTPSRDDLIKYFNMAIDSTGKLGSFDDFQNLEQDLFGKWVSPDISGFIKDHKKDPQGATKFAKYMLVDRPKGNFWFPRERGWKTDAEMKDMRGKYKEDVIKTLKKIIKEELRQLRGNR